MGSVRFTLAAIILIFFPSVGQVEPATQKAVPTKHYKSSWEGAGLQGEKDEHTKLGSVSDPSYKGPF